MNETWPQFLDRVAEMHPEGRIGRAVCLAVEKAMADRGLVLPVAKAHATEDMYEDSKFSVAWDGGEHYVDIDVQHGGALEWFYTNRTTNETDGSESSSNPLPLPAALVERLTQVATPTGSADK